MSDGPERACLAIADVSGYTGYLAGVELDHAQDILADLISTVVEAMAPFQLSKLEGDAAFAFLPGDELDGSMLQDVVEGTYIAFRTRLRDIQLASSCECNACIRIPSLDLKFVVHHGAIARQQMLGTEELIGADVILVHRLLKNTVNEAAVVKAYALYTQAAVEAAGIDPARQDLVEHQEATDVAGDVTTWIRDLEARWQAELARPRREIDPTRQLGEWSWDFATPRATTWEYITSPARRPGWDLSISSIREENEGGRRGVGTTNHCLHGEQAVREEVVDWRPPLYWMIKGFVATTSGERGLYLSYDLEELPSGGSRVTGRAGLLEDDSPDEEGEALFAAFEAGFQVSMASLQEVLAEIAIAEPAASPVETPRSGGRHLTQPVGG